MLRRRALGVLAGTACVLTLVATACGSAPPPFHPQGVSVKATGAPAPTGVQPWPGKASWKFDPLPSDPLQQQLVQLDRDYYMAWEYAIYAKGADRRWESYLTSQLLAGNGKQTLPDELKQIIAAHHGYEGQEVISHTTVRTNPDLPGHMVVDYCINDSNFQVFDTTTGKVIPRVPSIDGSVHEEEQDSFSQVNGVWKLDTLDTFTSTDGSPLISPPECR